MEEWVEYLGLVAGACTTAAFVPQVVKTWKMRSGAGLSLGMYAIFVAGVSLWIAYGFILGRLSIILANVATLVLVAIILAMKVYFTVKEKRTQQLP